MSRGARIVGAASVAAIVAACGSKTSLLDPNAFLDASSDGDDASGVLPDATFLIPYHAAPTPDRALVGVDIGLQEVDLTIVMDTTGSMQPSIENLKSNLATHLIPALREAVPSIGVAIVDHKDFPISPYGSNGDYPVRIDQIVTDDVNEAERAVKLLMADGGGDEPEAQVPAMWHALTGGALRWESEQVPQRPPMPGRSGGVDFRPGSLPVIVLITDADWHDAKNVPYDARVDSAPTVDDLAAAFVAGGAKFIDVTDASSHAPEEQANALSDATQSSVLPTAFADRCGGGCCTDVDGGARDDVTVDGRCRLNFLHSNGAGVSDSIVEAVRALSVGTTIDVIATASNATTNAPGIDATKFIRALRAIEEGDASHGCAAHAAIDADGDGVKERFTEVVLGTRVCFEVLPMRNDSIPATHAPLLFDAWIDVLGQPGAVQLDRRLVRFEVPPTNTPG